MGRKPREKSGTGIYHVMLRGINRQDIFEDDEDYIVFKNQLYHVVFFKDENGKLQSSRCIIYAYCLMTNCSQSVRHFVRSKGGLWPPFLIGFS